MKIKRACDCNIVYNFKSMPNRGICVKCKTKWEFDLKSLDWYVVEKFDTKTFLRTDDELINRWIKN